MTKWTSRSITVLALAIATTVARAQDAVDPLAFDLSLGERVSVTMDNGDVITGTASSGTGMDIILEHPILGTIAIPRTRIQRIVRAQGPETLPVPRIPVVGPPKPPPPKPEPAPVDSEEGADEGEPEMTAATWSGRLALGLTASSGNTEITRLRLDGAATRRAPGTELSLNMSYAVANEGSTRTEHRFRGEARNTWTGDASRWDAFLEGTVELDEFQEFDARFSAGGGFAYRFYDTDSTFLSARAGVGGSQTVGGIDDDIIPEAILGFEYRHEFNDRHKISAQSSLFPSLDDLGDFRFIARAAWEMVLDPESNMTLQIGVEDRYDSTPNARKRNDVDYFAQVIISF